MCSLCGTSTPEWQTSISWLWLFGRRGWSLPWIRILGSLYIVQENPMLGSCFCVWKRLEVPKKWLSSKRYSQATSINFQATSRCTRVGACASAHHRKRTRPPRCTPELDRALFPAREGRDRDCAGARGDSPGAVCAKTGYARGLSPSTRGATDAESSKSTTKDAGRALSVPEPMIAPSSFLFLYLGLTTAECCGLITENQVLKSLQLTACNA